MSETRSSASEQSHDEEIQFGLNNFIGTFHSRWDKEQNVFTFQVKEAATGRFWKRTIGAQEALEVSKQGTKLTVEAISSLITNAFKGEEKNLATDMLFCAESYPLSTPASDMKDLATSLEEVTSQKCSLIVDISLKAVFLTVKVTLSLEEVERNEKIMIEDLLRKNFYFSQVIEKLELKNTLLEHKYILQSKQIGELENRLTELTQLFIQTLQLQKLKNLEALAAEQSQELISEPLETEEIDQFDLNSCNPNCTISDNRKVVTAKDTAWGSTCRLSNYVSIHNNYVEFQIESMTEECVFFFGLTTSEYDEQFVTDNNVIGSSQYPNSFAISLTDKKLYTKGKSIEQPLDCTFEQGDKIGMLVDFKQASLKFYKNGQLLIDSFKGMIDEEKKWYFCVSLCKADDSCSIVPKM